MNDPSAIVGPGVRYDLAGGSLSELRSNGLAAATDCITGGATTPSLLDSLPEPAAGQGYYYLVRASNSCASGGFGAGRETLTSLACAGP